MDNEDKDPNNPGFDASQLGQMFSQLGQMLSGMGSSMAAGGSSDPVNYDVAMQLARQQIGSHTPVSESERTAVNDAVHLVELWLDEATTFPAGVSQTQAWTPVEWLEKTLPTWKHLCNPLAEQISGAWTSSLPAEAKDMMGPMLGMIGQLGGMGFGTQLGQGLGHLAKDVLTSTDIGLPLAPEGTAVLLPAAINAFSEDLEQPKQEILVFLAAREAAYVRLFVHAPWLRQRLYNTVEEYARGIRIDYSGMQDLASGIDPQELMTNPGKLQELLGEQANFEPQTTPEQKAALSRLETLLALVEGWVETVVREALSSRIPSSVALAETMRRRRATGGPAEQTFANLVGLELRPRKVREAAALWQRLAESTDITQRDQVWAHPDLIPDADDLDNPAAFIDRVIGGDTSALDDPIAELEKTIAAENAQKKAEADGRDDSSTPKNDESSDDDK